jgi:methionyl-tRNA formyltransferase
MNLIFAGTPAFALPTLRSLHAAGHTIAAVYTQPDRAAGRGRKLRPSPVKEYAIANALLVRQPTTLRGEERALAELRPDAMVVVAYGLILPESILAVPRHGCINVHASLLPRWRGAAPVARAVEAGDTETGVTIMQMERGLDTGPILLQRPTAILETDTSASLEERLAVLGAEALNTLLISLSTGAVTARPQDHTGATYAKKIDKNEAWLDWRQPALHIHRKIRALNPRPVAATVWRGTTVRVWEADVATLPGVPAGEPGTVLVADRRGLLVQTGAGLLSIQRLQAPGGRALTAPEFLNGTPISVGDRLGR